MTRQVTALWAVLALIFLGFTAHAAVQTDTIKTSAGDLKIAVLGHASLMFEFGGKIIHVDPISKVADYSKLPKADMILITHEHFDHLDPDALAAVKTDKTVFVCPKSCADKLKDAIIISNGETKTVEGLKIEAVPAYNLVHKRDNGEPFHPKGRDNGYVITFGDKRVYAAGDTENTPEMKSLKNIDIAFLPVNLPYTMKAEMVVDAVKGFMPKILYPYHYKFGQSDLPKLLELMKGMEGVEVRVRDQK